MESTTSLTIDLITMEFSKETLERLKKLEAKYDVMGQDLNAYLDGLLYADYKTYWDYIHLDTLLSLQDPATDFHDEKIFIVYHQITELYFSLILHAIERLDKEEVLTEALMLRQMHRINGYFENLIQSFSIMIQGMDKEEFLKFRMSLLPASGFQSAQYRLIELCSTQMWNLIRPAQRTQSDVGAPETHLYDKIYWKSGATELATGKKTLTLRQFERKYNDTFLQQARRYRTRNLWTRYLELPEEEKTDALRRALRQHDFNANVRWPLMHYRSAVRYLHREPKEIKATGGTNWQKYLPPKNQRIVFYPGLWKEEELNDWGKSDSLPE